MPRNEDGDTGNPENVRTNITTSSIQPPSYDVATSNQQSSNSADDGNIVGQ